jgi:hypothetical protein
MDGEQVAIGDAGVNASRLHPRLILGIAAALLIHGAAWSPAATLTVNTTADEVVAASLAADQSEGAGLALREAWNWAAAGDTINIKATGTIALTASLVARTANVIVTGAGRTNLTISEASFYQVFEEPSPESNSLLAQPMRSRSP